ncbi:MAG TPA: diacylglycerol kinase family protein [Burkholderiales bacterium]|jgi:diacylglycerol kinase family enzyme|nr:diacylglycerol kinase family protein [Burkholderiales bacterium]
MQITLIHNPGAGGGEHSGRAALETLLRGAGHEVFYQSSDAEDWDAALKRPAELVVAAGGDGTVARVARRLAGAATPFAALPLGTANNIARSLGLMQHSLEQHVAFWPQARRMKLDLGIARGPWGEEAFIEGLGLGLFAWMMPLADESPKMAAITNADEALSYALKMLRRLLEEHAPDHIKATLDGADISGNYLLFEALNLPYVGPNLFLAPDAKPDDGLLDVVMVDEAHRDELLAAITGWQEGKSTLPRLPTKRGKLLKIEPVADNVHMDDKLWRAGDSELPNRGDIEVKLMPGAVEVLVPPV